MNLFISNFKPILIAALFILLLEVFVFKDLPLSKNYKSNLLVMAPYQKEKITRVFLVEKINRLAKKQATFIQVGDSSGFYGIRPNIIMDNLEDQESAWLNFGCCGRTGFSGYQSFFEIINNVQKKNALYTTRYLVLAMTPYYSPKKEFESGELSESLHNQNKLVRADFPSNALRLSITNGLYKGEFKNKLLSNRVNNYWGKTLDEMWPNIENLQHELGWMEHPAKPIDLPSGACKFDLEKESYLSQHLFKKDKYLFRNILDELYNELDKKGIKLMIVLNPVPCSLQNSPDVIEFNKILKSFSSAYPDVLIPFKEVRNYPDYLFRDKWHLNKKGAEKNSTEIGLKLNDLL